MVASGVTAVSLEAACLGAAYLVRLAGTFVPTPALFLFLLHNCLLVFSNVNLHSASGEEVCKRSLVVRRTLVCISVKCDEQKL